MPPLLDWGDRSHFDPRRDLPCVLCGKPTPLRSHDGEAAHKVCAEAFLTAHPGSRRFRSDTRPTPTRGTRRAAAPAADGGAADAALPWSP